MSIQAVGWVLDQDIPDSASKLVLISIANALNGKTGKCCPGIDLLAHESSCSRSTVKRKIKTLEEEGWITVTPGFTIDGRQTSNTYSLNLSPRSSQAEGGGFTVNPPEGVTAMDPSGGSTVTHLDEPEERTDSPPTPLTGGLANDLFQKIWTAWPEDFRGDRATAGGAFGRLMPNDQREVHAVIEAAVKMLARRHVKGHRFPRLATFIGRAVYKDFVDPPEIDDDGDFIITPQRPEWREWMGHIRKQNGQKGVDYFVKLGKIITHTRMPDAAG